MKSLCESLRGSVNEAAESVINYKMQGNGFRESIVLTRGTKDVIINVDVNNISETGLEIKTETTARNVKIVTTNGILRDIVFEYAKMTGVDLSESQIKYVIVESCNKVETIIGPMKISGGTSYRIMRNVSLRLLDVSNSIIDTKFQHQSLVHCNRKLKNENIKFPEGIVPLQTWDDEGHNYVVYTTKNADDR